MARGFDVRYGARPMKRAVESEVMVPLARALVGGGYEGQTLTLGVAGEALTITPSRTG